MSLEMFGEVLKSFPSLKHILLQGEGEPFLHRQFFDMVSLVRQRNIEVTTITNGTLFNLANTAKILQADFCKILVSLESPDSNRFRELRGVALEHVVSGIKRLLESRDHLGMERPTIGFSLVVLQQTMHEVEAVVDLYHRLKLDGGIPVFQPLEQVLPYLQHYQDEVVAEMITPESWQRFETEVRQNSKARVALDGGWEKKGFVEEFVTDWSVAGGKCPWLERAGFVTWQGYVMPCCTIKDGPRFSLGQIGRNSTEEIAANRDILRKMLCNGETPEPCAECEIAKQAVASLHRNGEKE